MAAILTLDEAKAALRFEDTDPERDDLLLDFVNGITDVVEQQVGFVAQRSIELEIRQYGTEVVLAGRNFLDIVSGVDVATGSPIDVTGMYIDWAGILRTTTNTVLPSLPWRLTVNVGLNPVPDAIKRGAAEVLIEAWATQRGSIAGGEARAFLIPYRAQAWLEPYTMADGFA